MEQEKRTYVGGVGAEDRSAEERRFEELGLKDFYWTFIKLQGRVDDLEEQLASERCSGS